jgi:hypothetical protein
VIHELKRWLSLKKFVMCKRKFEKYQYKARIITLPFYLEARCVR